MKFLCVMTMAVLLSLFSVVQAQEHQKKYTVKQYILPATAMFLSGAADGLNQALSFRYASLKRTFPGMNEQWWNPQVSWMNKYKNGDPTQGRRHPGSTTYLVFTTDGYHATRAIEHMFNAAAIAAYIPIFQQKRWYVYVAEVAGSWIINRAGFALVYNRFKLN